MSLQYHRWSHSSQHRDRRGGIVVLVAILMSVLVTLSVFAINLVYMEIARTELRIACDAAAKAAIVRLGSSQDQANARAFAKSVGKLNRVGGKQLSLTDAQIEFGYATRTGTGAYTFTANQTPLNSARITGRRSLNMIFGGFLTTNSFTPQQQSIVMRVNHDIALVLDRSGSMAFDSSNMEFAYPADRNFGTNFQNYFTPPSLTASRWKSLSDAVTSFNTVLTTRQLDAQVALTTFAEDYDFGSFSSVEASTDVALTKTYSQISSKMADWNTKVLVGDTNIEAGLAQGRSALIGAGSRLTAQRTIILLTDGVPTSGTTNLPTIAANYRAEGIVTHVITFGGQAASGANQTRMQNTAASGYGQYYHAPDSATLNSVFRQIAEGLPAVYID